MRKVVAAALAVPVIAILYLPLLARRSVAARLVLLGTVGVVVVVAAFGLAHPVPTTATIPAPPITALADDAFRSIAVATDLRAPIAIRFSEAMDTRSVAAAVTVEPATPVTLAWTADRTVLTITPTGHWAPGTYHIVTVAPGALAASGRPIASATSAAFVTRTVTTARITATQILGNAVAIETAFRVTFDQPVTTASAAGALKITPTVAGTLSPVTDSRDAGPGVARTFLFTPAAPLAPGTRYHVSIDGVVDADGGPVLTDGPLSVTTTAAPGVVRLRPVDGSTKVDRKAILSVRFTTAMSHATTRAAFRVTANGAAVAGSISFAEGSTVLVFTPTKALPAAATIVVSVGAGATSTHGMALSKPVQATLHTAAAPAKAATVPIPRPTSGGSVGSGSWGAVELYYLKLLNCTHTGGWVTSTGTCSSPGGRNVAPLRLDAGISSRVSRPYAKKLAISGVCSHYSGGSPGDRLRAAGYPSYIWAENLGCQYLSPYASMLSTHLFFQSEKSYNGGHYVNMMNAAYDRVGIGVWVCSGRIRLVVDFYHPL